jgi:hypothetical protein
MERSAITPEQKDILAQVGMAVVVVQAAEQIIRLVMAYVIQGSEPLTLEYLQSLNQKERNKTIGFLWNQLRKRVDLDDSFDNTLCRFLEMRNTLIHNLDEISGGWSLDNEQGRDLARKFLSEFGRVMNTVVSVFLGLVRSWQEQVGMNDRDIGIPPDPWLADIDAKYKPLVEDIFFATE